MKLFDGNNIPLLRKALQAYSLRHNAIASNLANINTPGYRSQRVAFEDQLQQAISQQTTPLYATDEKHFGGSSSIVENAQPVVQYEQEAEADASGVNNVDIDFEMAELARNQLRYKIAARFLSDTFKGIQKSIRGQL